MRSPTSRMGWARSGNRRTKDSPSVKTSFCVMSSRPNGLGTLSRWACKSDGNGDFKRIISLRAALARLVGSIACRPTMSERKSLRLASHCSRQRATRRRDQGLAAIVSTNRPAPRPTTVAASRLWKTQGGPAQVLIDAIQHSAGKKKYVGCNLADLPTVWQSGQFVDFFAKMTDGLVNRKIWIQTPIIGLIELQFFRQHAFLRTVYRAQNR